MGLHGAASISRECDAVYASLEISVRKVGRRHRHSGGQRQTWGIQSDRLVEIGNGSVVVTFTRITGAPIVKGGSAIRIESNRLVEIGNGSVVVAFVRITDTPLVEGGSALRTESNGPR
jgi:hypothetical protein